LEKTKKNYFRKIVLEVFQKKKKIFSESGNFNFSQNVKKKFSKIRKFKVEKKV